MWVLTLYLLFLVCFASVPRPGACVLAGSLQVPALHFLTWCRGPLWNSTAGYSLPFNQGSHDTAKEIIIYFF